MDEELKVPVVLLGAGGYATVIYEILRQHADVLILGCTDKVMGLSERAIGEGLSLRILGDDDILPELADEYPDLHAVLALGTELMDVRARLATVLQRQQIPARTAIHPRSIISQTAIIGPGTVVQAGGVLAPGCEVGYHGVIGIHASIDHDARIGNNVYIDQGARVSSYVEISDHVVIEMGASINSRVKIGQGARITGGAFVNTDVPDHAVVVGVPGRVVRYSTTP